MFNYVLLAFSQEIVKQKLPKDEFTRPNQDGGSQGNKLVLSSARSDSVVNSV